jgi:large subunit ribosomal protein L10
MKAERQVLQQKAREVEEVCNTLQQYKVIALASLEKVRAAQLQQLRKKLEKDAFLRVTKNTLIKRAIAQVKDKPNLEIIGEHLTGATIYVFTNLNPFKLVILLQKSKVITTAKAGDIAAFDVVIPAGNTGQPPGPIISQLSAVGLKTRIESGSVYISKDTLVVKEGETISERLAAVLSKLGIKPVEAGLSLKAVYDDGMMITEEQLDLDLNETRKAIEEAHRFAYYLAMNSTYPTTETISPLLQKAHQDAYNLSLNKDIFTRDTIVDIFRKAQMQASSLKNQLEPAEKTTQKD